MTKGSDTYSGLLSVKMEGDTFELVLDGRNGITHIEVTPTDGVILSHSDGSKSRADSISIHALTKEVSIEGMTDFV